MLNTENIYQNNKIKNLIEFTKTKDKVKVVGPEEACFSFMVSNIIQKLNKKVLIITHDNSRIETIYEDMIRVIDKERVSIFPEIEALPHEKINPDYNILKERISVLNEMQFANHENVVITSGTSILRKLMPKKYFRKKSIDINIDSEINLNEISTRLVQLGYEREKMVEEPGQFSIRGGILDIYTLVYDNPVRIELFGDEVDSIRFFNVESQRSVENIDDITITPVNEIVFDKKQIEKFLPKIKRDYKKQIQRLEETDSQNEADYLKQLSGENLDKLSEFHYFERA